MKTKVYQFDVYKDHRVSVAFIFLMIILIPFHFIYDTALRSKTINNNYKFLDSTDKSCYYLSFFALLSMFYPLAHINSFYLSLFIFSNLFILLKTEKIRSESKDYKFRLNSVRFNQI